MKSKIQELISSQDYEKAEQLIYEYAKKSPKDMEIFSFNIAIFLAKGDIERAYIEAENAVATNPFYVEANYNLATVAERAGDYVKACYYYINTDYLQKNIQDKIIPPEMIEQQINYMIDCFWDDADKRALFTLYKCFYEYSIRDPFKNHSYQMVGTAIVDCFGQEYFAGYCDGFLEAYFEHGVNRDAFRAKCEFFPIAHIGTEFDVEENVLVPVVMNYDLQDKSPNCIMEPLNFPGNAYCDSAIFKYSFIPVSEAATLKSTKNAIWGKPMPLHALDRNKKKLILNIFIDSFNYCIIEKNGLEALMPYTAGFFSDGIHCKQYYTCSEYTLPSIATYWTGKQPSMHMNLHNQYRHNFMGDKQTFSELFQQAGYTTAKFGGNDSVTPAQGYIRGFDRFVYQYSSEGQTVKETVMDTLEHLRTFRDTNQFLWIDIVDLHDIAGGFMRSIEVQSKSSLRTRYSDNEGTSTVKQSRSQNREIIYKNELAKIDFYLSLLFHFIEEQYKDEEIIVSLFSDHGTAFLVENSEPMVSHQRMRIPLFIRSGNISGEVDEIIETTDYAGIIAKLAGVPYSYEDKDANLPKCFGGEKEREYAFSQSIFIGDPYIAAFHAKGLHCYIKTRSVVEEQFLIDFSDFEVWMVDDEGNPVEDKKMEERFVKILKDKIGHLLWKRY